MWKVKIYKPLIVQGFHEGWKYGRNVFSSRSQDEAIEEMDRLDSSMRCECLLVLLHPTGAVETSIPIFFQEKEEESGNMEMKDVVVVA